MKEERRRTSGRQECSGADWEAGTALAHLLPQERSRLHSLLALGSRRKAQLSVPRSTREAPDLRPICKSALLAVRPTEVQGGKQLR